MRSLLLISIIALLSITPSCKQAPPKTRTGLPGNNIVQFIQSKDDKTTFFDPIDDSSDFKKITDNLYRDNRAKIYIINVCFKTISHDTILYTEYFKDVSGFLDINSYKKISTHYFSNKGKVYRWWTNADGDYPVEVMGANPASFVEFEHVAGGKDKNFVFYGGPPRNLEKIPGANPNTIKVLNPKHGCWNCGNCYFVDDKSVYCGLNKVKGADPKTFRLVNEERVDAADKNSKFFEGVLVEEQTR